MFKHILVPLDGSALAETALPAAMTMARLCGSRLTLIHLVEQGAPEEVHGQSHLQTEKEAEAYLEAIAEKLPAGIPIEWHVHEASARKVSEGLVAHAREMDHDLICMCSHGQGMGARFLMGTIAQQVVAEGDVPVLMIQPDESGQAPAFEGKVILAPLDGGPDHVRALPVAQELALTAGAVLHLAVVVHRYETLRGQKTASSRLMPGTTSEWLEMAAEEARDYLDRVTREMAASRVQVVSEVLRGDPAEVLAALAREIKADLLVLATHGKTGLSAFWSGSVAHQICTLCRLPLLLIPLGK